MPNFEAMAQRAALFELTLFLIFIIASIWVSYEILKRAIRDGIKEAIEGRRFNPPTTATPAAPQGFKWVLVKTDETPDTVPMNFSAKS